MFRSEYVCGLKELLRPSTLEVRGLVLVLQQEVDVVQSLHEAMLLEMADVENLALAVCQIGDRLTGQIDTHLRSMVLRYAVEQLLQERLADLYGQDKIVEFVVLVNVGKERTDDHAEAIAGDGPCGMLARRATTKILPCNKDAPPVGRIVEHKLGVRASVGVIPPVGKQATTEAILVGRLQKTGRHNLVSVYVLQRYRDAG